jgi:translation initiation factor 1A
MVKNKKGGNKHKKMGRKYLNEPEKKIRYKCDKEEDEQYACIVKILGGSVCQVLCEDGKIRQCIIRKKFRGRGKWDNIISSHVIVLVGIRSWEIKMDGKMQKSDLLQVYSSTERTKLIVNNKLSQKTIEMFDNLNEFKIDKNSVTETQNETNIEFDDI